MSSTLLSLIITTLRSPGSVVDDATSDAQTAWLVPRLLLITAVGGAVFGAVVGAHHGGIQVLYAAIKMPILFLVPLAVGLPAIRALFASDDSAPPWRRVAMAGLVGAARTGILAAAASPFLWLAWSLFRDYHMAILVLAASLLVIGGQGLLTLRHALPKFRLVHVAPLGIAVVLMGLTTALTGWVLRPFMARPTPQITFLRPIEAAIGDGLLRATRSAAGDYGREGEEWAPSSSGLMSHGLRGRDFDGGQ
jgi:hypothetical protein